MRSTLLLLMLILPGLAILNSVWFGSELRRFVREVASFGSTTDIERFKGVVARQMYAALLQILLLGAPPILFFIGLVRDQLLVGDVVFIIVPAAVVIAVAALFKQVETQARRIPAADDELARQRDAIIQTWIKKPLPNW